MSPSKPVSSINLSMSCLARRRKSPSQKNFMMKVKCCFTPRITAILSHGTICYIYLQMIATVKAMLTAGKPKSHETYREVACILEYLLRHHSSRDMCSLTMSRKFPKCDKCKWTGLVIRRTNVATSC